MMNRVSCSNLDRFKLMLANLFFPNTCMICGEAVLYDSSVCNKCAKEVQIYDGSFCPICEENYADCRCNYKIISPFIYSEGIERAIWDLKFNGIRFNSQKLGFHISNAVKNACMDNIDIIIPIPMYKFDEYKRGYNQSILIAQDISRRIGVKYSHSTLLKIKRTGKQHTLDRKHRKSNLEGCLVVNKISEIKEKTVLLVDDVITTGATVETAIDVLKANGAKTVICAVAAVVKSRKSEKSDEK